MFFDIHSHILPGVDDGAENIDEAMALLKLEDKNKVSSVMLTPHFYPNNVTLEEFCKLTSDAFGKLKQRLEGTELPRVYLGAEVLYFYGIGNADGIEKLTLNGSEYILIELGGNEIGEMFYRDILNLQQRGLTPIIAHIERYYGVKKFRDLLDFVIKNEIMIQINAASVLHRRYMRTIKTLMKSGLFCVLGSDAHSLVNRPPLIDNALAVIGRKFGREHRAWLIKNSQILHKEIVGVSVEE